MQVPAAQKRTHFGSFAVDLASRELSKNGRRINLQELPFQVLAVLLEHPGELVTREEIQGRLWPADTFVDFEHGIYTAIKKLREALEDDAEQPRFIETLPKRGYRFIGAIQSEDPPAAERTAEPSPEPSKPSETLITSTTKAQTTESTETTEQTRRHSQSFSKRTLPKLALSAVVIGALVIVSTIWWESTRSAKANTRVMLAVLPFDNLSADSSEDYFAEGMTEELITQLGGWNPARLGVIARTSTDLYRHANKSVGQVGHELGVDYIVEGSARRDGSQVRITAQLIQVRDQTHLWAKEYDRDQRNVLALENEVAADVADEISVALAPTTKLNSTLVDPEAHEDYLKGEHYWNQLTCQGFEAALPMFEGALQRDPKFAAAEASLAATYYKLADFDCRPESEMMRHAKEAATKAIELDGQLAQAHAVLGIVADQYDWDRRTAVRELKLATELDPNDAIAHTWYGAISCEIGRQDLCLAEIEKAHRLDPVALITNIVNAYMLYFLRRYDEALEVLHKTLDLYPGAGPAYTLSGEVYERKGNYAKAGDNYLKGRELNRQPDAVIERYRAAIAREGWRGYWTEELQDATAHNPPNDCAMVHIYAHLEDKDRELEALEKGFGEHCADMSRIKIDPLYDFVRSEPRFQAVLKLMGLHN